MRCVAGDGWGAARSRRGAVGQWWLGRGRGAAGLRACVGAAVTVLGRGQWESGKRIMFLNENRRVGKKSFKTRFNDGSGMNRCCISTRATFNDGSVNRR